MMKDKKKKNILKVEKPTADNISTLKIAEKKSQYSAPGKAGRKPIETDKKQSEAISFKITKKQLESINQQAGMVPTATFIKAKLKEVGVL